MQFVPSGYSAVTPADCVVGFQTLLCNIFGLLQHDPVGWSRKIKKHVKRHCGGQKDRTHRSLLIWWWSTFLSFWCLIWCQDRYFLGPWGWIYVARIGCIQKGKEPWYVFVEHHFSCSNPAGIFNLNTPWSSLPPHDKDLGVPLWKHGALRVKTCDVFLTSWNFTWLLLNKGVSPQKRDG